MYSLSRQLPGRVPTNCTVRSQAPDRMHSWLASVMCNAGFESAVPSAVQLNAIAKQQQHGRRHGDSTPTADRRLAPNSTGGRARESTCTRGRYLRVRTTRLNSFKKWALYYAGYVNTRRLDFIGVIRQKFAQLQEFIRL